MKTARRNHEIAGQKRAKVNPEILSLSAAAKYCGVSNKSIERLVAGGKLPVWLLAEPIDHRGIGLRVAVIGIEVKMGASGAL